MTKEMTQLFKKSIKAILPLFLMMMVITPQASAQDDVTYQEYGFWIGSSTYFGDLNPSYNFNKTRPAFGAFYKYSIGPYIAFKGGVSYASVAGTDELSTDPFPERRNLSFRSNIFEVGGHVEFNFVRYIPGSKKYFAAPYLTVGLSMFHFEPQAEYQGTWYNLRELGTEGQQNGDFSGKTAYNNVQASIPVGLGFKYWIQNRWNFGIEANYRFAFTDYIDDVGGTYVNPNILGTASVSAALADRSSEVGDKIGSAGRQRGDSVGNDAFVFVGIFVTYTIFEGNCPK